MVLGLVPGLPCHHAPASFLCVSHAVRITGLNIIFAGNYCCFATGSSLLFSTDSLTVNAPIRQQLTAAFSGSFESVAYRCSWKDVNLLGARHRNALCRPYFGYWLSRA